MTLIVGMATLASAATYNFYDNLYHQDGLASRIDPWGGSALPFDFGGVSLGRTITAAGNHNVVLMVDAEIDESLNTFFNELGSAHGSLAAGQSWQIGDPMAAGGIYDLTLGGALTNSDLNGGQLNDVALALGWNFTLGADQKANLLFALSDTLPDSGFYLEQYDRESDAHLYFTGILQIVEGGTPTVPEPSTLLLLGAGLAGAWLLKRRDARS